MHPFEALMSQSCCPLNAVKEITGQPLNACSLLFCVALDRRVVAVTVDSRFVDGGCLSMIGIRGMQTLVHLVQCAYGCYICQVTRARLEYLCIERCESALKL